MRCCAPNCKNDSRYISKLQGITFHIFPTERSIRTAWLQALGKLDWEPKERSAVCSEHFLCEDMYETKSGLRKVRLGAIPMVEQNPANSDYGEQVTTKVCRICLTMDSKLLPIEITKLKEAYENLTNITITDSDRLPQMLCTECAQRLLNSNEFKLKSLRANSVLNEMLEKQYHLTINSIKTINRDKYKLTSSLTIKNNNPEHYDLELTHIEELPIEYIEHNNIPKVEKNPENFDLEVKEEVFFEEIPKSDSENDFQKEFPISEHYSSDDSLPLKKCQAKKRKKVLKRQLKSEKPVLPKIDRRRKPFLNDDLTETLFTVTDLTVEEQIADIIKRQESANYRNAIFKCTVCYKGFLDEDAYNTHAIRHTNESGEHECTICKTHFKHSHALRKHTTAHHTQRFSCNQCTYVTTHRQTARLHVRWHNGTKYSCPHCPVEFHKFTTYMGHLRKKHPSDHVCEICGYSFVSNKGIELHKKLKHRLDEMHIPEDGPFCELCNVRFVSEEAHRRHLSVAARHIGEDKESDSIKSRTGRRSNEERRLQDSEGIKKKSCTRPVKRVDGPFPCEQCGLQLEDSRAYHSHFRRTHPDKNRTKYPSMRTPCMCEVCGRMFQSQALLKDHTWVHTSERPFKCDICQKSFQKKQRLVAHQKVHSEVRATYVCGICGKQFSTHSNRQRHMFIHTGLKPFKCEMCGKAFKHSAEKRAHITYVHLKKPWPKRTRGKRRPETRQGQLPPHQGPHEMEISSHVWPQCDPKLGDMNAMIEDKPVYYNLKI
ncbi:uncharacterized protein LOC142985635 [Anticarsia gemmatalis]|uniref:uncharacterized protein LOC142985635 n=1 Tax=Anticarsia gemmatalis TaxID=129554 RepID=UPI003F7746A4